MCYKLFKPNYTQQHLGVDAAQFVHIVLHFVVCFESPLQFPENPFNFLKAPANFLKAPASCNCSFESTLQFLENPSHFLKAPFLLSESPLAVYLWF